MGENELQRSSSVRAENRMSEAQLVARARERRQLDKAARREQVTESVFAAVFVPASLVAYFAFDGATTNWLVFGWLVLICALLVRVEFEVGEGCTRPVMLVVAPMLVLLPAGAVPLAIVAGHVAAQLPDVARRRLPPRRLLMGVADSWFSLAPAIVVGLMGLPSGWLDAAAVALSALVAQFALDFAVSGLRVRIGTGISIPSLLRPFAWVWFVDLLLMPIGVLVAIVARDEPLLVAGVLPLGALLGVFARERTGRIDNAMALHRIAQDGQDRLESIVQHASDLIAIIDADGTILTLTGSVEPIFGTDRPELHGRAFVDYVHPDDAARLTALLAGIAAKPAGHSQEVEWRQRYADGSFRHVSALVTNLLQDTRVGGLVITARDVDARKAFEEQLRHRAFHDPLTALANRALFYDRIEHALARELRHDGHAAVLYLDLDDFKKVNDRFGHAVGDELLIDVASRLRACARNADTVARLGGDEFGLLLESVHGPNEPIQTGERILAAFNEPFALHGEPITIAVSIGIGLSDAQARGVDELLRSADLAMYAAKRNGKRRLELYDKRFERSQIDDRLPITSWFHSTDEQREEVRSVLENPDALAMVFQPIVDLRTGQVAGYEALSRFNDALQRPPSAWFAQAHRCGLGYELEAKALAAALAVHSRPPGTYLTVNLSPSALTSAAVARVLPERLDGLVIEITENEVLTEDPQTAAALAAVRRRGARLAIDDTGSGYAGLTSVMRLAPDVIKLDRTLIAGVADDPVKAALIESFVRYAREIDASVCAEGIEDMRDLARLADLDVSYGQGYGLGRPAAAWASVEPAAADTCRLAFAAILSRDTITEGDETHDARLELLTDQLALADRPEHLEPTLALIARELHADAIRVLTPHGSITHPSESVAGAQWTAAPRDARQTLIGDPTTPADDVRSIVALGYCSRLEIPICSRTETAGTLEAYALQGRPWTRFEIRRARIIANSMGGALTSLNDAVAHPR
jgi:diguanylate cyclase (GGDEF)-like protein/PAS domain S-box-containing protein